MSRHIAAPFVASDDEPNQLTQSAYHEAGHAVAHVGLLGEVCYDVRAFAEPTLTYDDRGRAMTVMGLCQTSFGSQPPELTVQDLLDRPERAPIAFARAINRVFSCAAGPFAQAELVGGDDLFDEDGGDGDLEHAQDALLSFYEDEGERWDVLDHVWRRTRDIMRRPQVWAAVEAVASQLIALGGREALDGDIVHRIVERHLGRRRFRTTAIIPVKWDGSVNRTLLSAKRSEKLGLAKSVNTRRTSMRKSVPDAECDWSRLNSFASGMTNPKRS